MYAGGPGDPPPDVAEVEQSRSAGHAELEGRHSVETRRPREIRCFQKPKCVLLADHQIEGHSGPQGSEHSHER
jgi:hypothetical protein